jgi:hypothetical protein
VTLPRLMAAVLCHPYNYFKLFIYNLTLVKDTLPTSLPECFTAAGCASLSLSTAAALIFASG